MKKNAKSAFALTLAIVCGLASPLRSDASPDALSGSGCSRQGRIAVVCARPEAVPDAALSEVCGRVVKVADGDTITVLDAANSQHKIRLGGIDAPEKSQGKDGVFTFWSRNTRKYVSVDEDKGNVLIADRDVVDAWEEFRVFCL